MSDADRIALESWLRAQDPEAFKQLVTRYAGMVYGTCLRILKNPADAEDVAQESFVALAYARDASKVRSLGAWLHQVATNLSLRRIRGEVRRAQRDTRYAAHVDSITQPSHDDLMRHVDEAIVELPDHLRMPLVAYYLQDRTQSAIAEELGVSRQLVTHRVAQGLEQLRRRLRRKGVLMSTAALGAALSETAGAQAPATLLSALAKAGLAGSTSVHAPHIAATVAAIGRAGAFGGMVLSKTVGIAAAVVFAVGLGTVATCERPTSPVAASPAVVAAPEPEPAGMAEERVTESVPVGSAREGDPVDVGYELRMAGKIDDAIALLRATVEQDPDNARAYFELARTAMHGLLPQEPVTDRKNAERQMVERAKLATWAIYQAIEAEPDNPRYHFWRGTIDSYSAMAVVHSVWQIPQVPGRLSDSRRAYATAVALDPDNNEARYQLAGLYDRLPFYLGGNKKKYKAQLEELETRGPVWAARLTAERASQESDEAERVALKVEAVTRMEEIVRECPEDPEAHEALAQAHLRLVREEVDTDAHADAGLNHLKRAVALEPCRADVLVDYGYMLYFRKDYARAEAAASHVQTLEPVAPIAAAALELLALIRTKQGHVTEAEELHRQAHETHPILDIPPVPARELFAAPE